MNSCPVPFRRWRRTRVLQGLLCVAVLSLAFDASAAEGWSGWRGPEGRGIADGAGIFEGGAKLNKRWSQAIGASYSGVSLDGSLLVTGSSNETSDLIVALDADTGALRWQFAIGKVYQGHDGSENGPLSTPAIAGTSVYALGSHGKLVALQRDSGAQRWAVDLKERYEAVEPYFGFASSPIVQRDTLFLAVGGSKAGLVALRTKDGSEIWRSTGLKIDYESPLLATIAGRPQIVISSAKRTVGLDPADGGELWSIELASSGSGTPVLLASGKILIAGEGESHALQVQASAKGKLEVATAWSSSALKQNSASPVLIGDHLYGFDSRFLTCVDAATGERVWKSRPPGGHGLIAIDDHLIVFDAEGTISTVLADPGGYVAGPSLALTDKPSYTPPSYADGKIFVRDGKMLASIEIAREPTEGVAP